MSFVSIVVPVYHNATSLSDLHQEFVKLAINRSQDTFEFVFVDDGSRDNSFEVLQNLATQDHRIRVFKLSRNFGSNAAILAGLVQTRGDVVGVISADLQDPPSLFNEMLELWHQGRKVVLAARSERDDSGLASFISDTFYWMFRHFAIKTMPQRGFDFFLIDRQVCDLIKGIQENNAYLMGLILWLGFDPAVLYYRRQKRAERYGQSMWTFTRKLKYFLDSFVAFSYMPVRAASTLGILLSLVGLVYAVIVIILRLFTNFDAAGWSSLMVVLLIVSGAQMIMLGILGEYMWRNLDETRRRPRFVVERSVEHPDSSNPS